MYEQNVIIVMTFLRHNKSKLKELKRYKEKMPIFGRIHVDLNFKTSLDFILYPMPKLELEKNKTLCTLSLENNKTVEKMGKTLLFLSEHRGHTYLNTFLDFYQKSHKN